MKEVEITYENLFKLISEEESVIFENEQEYFQKTPLQIQNENDEWVSIKGLIKKESTTVKIEIDNSTEIICADKHLIQLNNGNMKYAHCLVEGDKLQNGNNGSSTVTKVELTNKIEEVFDVEVDSQKHLYQCALGLVHHNTLLTSAIVEYANRLNMRTITIVPSSSLLKQTYEYIKQFDIPVGMFGAGKRDDEPNMVATWQTLQNNKSFIRPFECIIWDECVHPSSKIRMADNSEKRIDEINVGDSVKTINEKTRQIENKPVLKVHKNLLKSENQTMFKITMDDDTSVSLTGNHEVLTTNGWKRTDALSIEDDIISLAEQFDYHLIELYLKKQFDTTISDWFEITPTTISRWKKKMPIKYIDLFKERTQLSNVVDLIKKIY